MRGTGVLAGLGGDGEGERSRLCPRAHSLTHTHLPFGFFFVFFLLAHMCMSDELLCQAGDTSHVNRF